MRAAISLTQGDFVRGGLIIVYEKLADEVGSYLATERLADFLGYKQVPLEPSDENVNRDSSFLLVRSPDGEDVGVYGVYGSMDEAGRAIIDHAADAYLDADDSSTGEDDGPGREVPF